MTLVPALRLGAPPLDEDEALRQTPHNLEAEQALLGAVLFDNAAYERVGDGLQAAHFYEPFHARLYAAIEDHLRKGQLAEPIVLLERFRRDPAFEQLGGVRYLADLVDRAPPGANAAEYARVIIDCALRRNLLRIAGEVAVEVVSDDGARTARDLLESAEAKLFTLAETGTQHRGFVTFETALSGAIESASAAYGRDGALTGISTGLIDLDQKLGGLHRSDLIIIAARPSMGKSALAGNIAGHAARSYSYERMPDGTEKVIAGARVGFFSLEMSSEQIAMRMLAENSGVAADRIRRGAIRADEFGRIRDGAVEIGSAPLYIDDTAALTIEKLSARARRLKRTSGLDLIIVDYLQLIGLEGWRNQNSRATDVGVITAGLKALAKDLDVPVVALAQLSRRVEERDDKRPQLSDLRESGSIEQDADVVMFIFREAYYLKRTEPAETSSKYREWQDEYAAAEGNAEIIIGKQRHGPTGTVRLAFDEDLTKFGNLARDFDFGATKQTMPYRDD